MRIRNIGGQAVVGLLVGFGACLASASAAPRTHQAGYAHAGSGHVGHARFGHYAFSGGGGLQCVPFARENTGIELAGNAATWWSAAQGLYERGAKPEVGSVLNFRANGRMRMGHVAVVSNVVDSRNIEIDHANWAGPGASRGGISRNITVVDVSPGNDWSAVRVALGHTGEFGSVYPTYGFIYDRPDHGVMVANTETAPAPVLNAAPRDLRPVAERLDLASNAPDSEEVAEAADDAPQVRRAAYRHGAFVRGISISSHAHAASRHAGLSRAESRANAHAEARPTAASVTHGHHAASHRRT